MIIRREALKAALHCCVAGNSRYVLSALQVHPHGMVEATNGHVLVQVTDRSPQADSDFPNFAGHPPLVARDGPVLLPQDLALRLIAGTPKRTPITILTSVQIGITEPVNGEPGIVQGRATDLQVPVVVDLREAQEQRFPDTKRIMVTEGQREGVVKLILSAEVLNTLLQITKQVGKTITLEIPTEGQYQFTRQDEGGNTVPDGMINSAIRFTVQGTDLSVEGVAMPCRP